MERGQIVPKSKENCLLYFKKMLWIKAPITSLIVVFMRPIMLIRWAYCIVSESHLICGVEYGFLILTWIPTVIFHS